MNLRVSSAKALLNTTEKIAAEYPDLPTVYDYEELRNALERITGSDKN